MICVSARKVLRDLWLHKSRTALVIAAISVGLIGAGSVLNTWSLVRLATREGYDSSKPASAVVRLDSVDARLLTGVRALREFEAVEARRTVFATVHSGNGRYTAMLSAAADYARRDIGIVAPVSGAWPPSHSGVVVETSSVDFSGIHQGDSISVRIGDNEPVSFGVSGIARDVGVAPGWMEHVAYLFVTPEALVRLGAPAAMNELHLRVRDRAISRDSVGALVDKMKRLAESQGRVVSDVNVPAPGRHIHAAQIESLLLTQGAFAFLSLALSGLLVINLISAMLTGQVREIGIMKAIGGSSHWIATMYLGIAFALGVVASAVSIPIAVVLGRAYAELTGGMLNFDVQMYSIPWSSFAIQLFVGLLLPVVAALAPVMRGAGIGVGDAVRDIGIAHTAAAGGGEWLSRFGGLTRPVILSLRNTFRKRQRLILTLATLSLGGAVYLGALNLKRSISNAIDSIFAAQRFDVAFRFATPHDADSLATAVRSLAGVQEAEAWAGTRASIENGDGRMGSAFPITAPPAATRMFVAPVVEGRWLSGAEVNEMVVNRAAINEHPELSPGTHVKLRIRGSVVAFTVVGVVESGPTQAAYASRETLDRLAGGPMATTAVVRTMGTTASARLSLIRKLRGELANRGFDVATSQAVSEQRAVIEDHMLMVASFLGDMSLLMIVVGGLGLASSMSMSVIERTREIGVLRAIGASHSAIITMVLVEAVVIAGLSWLIAIPLSLPMSATLARSFGRVMMNVPVVWVPPLPGLAQWLALVIAVSLVACAWPAFRATRITTSSALAYE